MLSQSKHHTNIKGNSFSKLISCCLFFVLATGLNIAKAQTHGTVEVVKDPRIDTLMMRRLEPAKIGGAPASGGYISADGYRIQFFSGSNRGEAYNAQQRFQQRFPDLRTYITYREPNFKVRAGDFRTRLEATKYLQQIRAAFPTLFIVSEKINPPSQ